MKRFLTIILITALALCTLTCKKFVEPDVYVPEEPPAVSYIPEVGIDGISDITISSAKFACTITYDGDVTIIDRGVCWSTEHNPDLDGSHVSSSYGTGSYTCDITELEHATTYYVRAYAVNSYGTGYSEEQEFKTLTILSSVTTKQVTEITVMSAKSGGIVTDDGGGTVTARGVCWSTSENPTIDDAHTTDGAGLGEFDSALSGLVNSTQYYVRAYATNESGTTYGQVVGFTTISSNIITSDVTEITMTSAISGGTIIDDGGGTITAKGVCWNTLQNPTIDNAHTTDGAGPGTFTSSLSGLTSNTTYYVRAYVTTEGGTMYGDEVSFITLSNGLFSVSTTQKVRFASGNLRYKASTNTWRFAERQYDYIGNGNTNISPSYAGYIDLFGWGTGDNPTNTSVSSYDVFNDWGNNTIENGGDVTNWRTLTKDEWYYLLKLRQTDSNKRFAKAVVASKNGIIILPNDWNPQVYSLNTINTSFAPYSNNVIDGATWMKVFEPHGAVFIPAAGFRNGTSLYTIGTNGCYWSSSSPDEDNAKSLVFTDESLEFADKKRYFGYSVRLVYDAE